MRRSLTVAAAAAVALILAAPSPGVADEKPNAREQFVTAAKSVKMRSEPKVVEDALAALGKPKVSFKWCNRAGCVERKDEPGSNRMYVNYTRQDGEKLVMLMVMFCTEAPGAWQVAMVSASTGDEKAGAFGTVSKPESLFRDKDTDVPGCMARR